MSDCTWSDPGVDRYTGSALIAAWERREFTDTVVIDRTAIRGQTHDYAPEITSMHFGSQGRVCASVTRSGWEDLHVETAIVLCSGAECIAVPSVCSNVARVTRVEAAPAAARPADDPLNADLVAVLPPLTDPVDAALIRIAADPEPATVWRRWPEPSAPSGFWTATNPPRQLAPIPVSPVPEPQSWHLLGLGLAGVLLAANLRKSTSFRKTT